MNEYVKKVLEIDKEHGEKFITLAITHFADLLSQGKYTSPAVEKFNMWDTAVKLVAWDDEQRKQLRNELGITRPEENELGLVAGSKEEQQAWADAEARDSGSVTPGEWKSLQESGDEEEEY